MITIATQIAQELSVNVSQIEAAIKLMDEGATVPFIARYRKEATQGLDDNHLRQLSTRLGYLRELEERRHVVLTNIEQQGLLTQALKNNILAADNKTRLEDLYLPYKPKRRTKGQMAIEAGIAPLADALFNRVQLDPKVEAQQYINDSAGYACVDTVLEGASAIISERMSEDAELLAKLRHLLNRQAHIVSRVVKSKMNEAVKYKDYFEHSEALTSVPSHRMLAMLRGRNESFLKLSIDVDPQTQSKSFSSAQQLIMDHYDFRLSQQAGAAFMEQTIAMAWKTKLSQSLETEFFGQLRDRAELSAIDVFANNLKDLLMAAPAGAKVTLGLDPGLRTGCKIAVVDATGKLLQTATIFPHAPQNNWDKSVRTVVNLCRQNKVELIAIGNGTGSRETDKLVTEVLTHFEDKKPTKLVVSEAGASVYSASELAANEFPDLDVSIRGAVSIARRLQDPLAELVKIDPKAIGVGQYQHDVNQSMLSKSLEHVIEDCVNKVGVDLNSASSALLSHVAGLNKVMAKNVVQYRDEHGSFTNRKELLNVARLGPKAFEQAAGFLRIRAGDNVLDNTGVHPESYPVVEQIIASLNTSAQDIMTDAQCLNDVDINQFVSAECGEMTLNDIIEELKKPGRDPRPEFKTATFKEGIEKIADLSVGMVLEGVISNVANFGAFVDIGVHQDGLVHISAITDKFIKDPREFVKAGDIVKVKVLEVDAERKRINLTMRLNDNAPQMKRPTKESQKANSVSAKGHSNKKTQGAQHKPKKEKTVGNAAMGNAFAEALAKLKE